MTAVDPVYAQWLMADTLWSVVDDVTRKARWGTTGIATSRATTIATKADAQVEGERQLSFLGGPTAEEEHLLTGSWAAFIGQVVTLTGPQLGYDNGLDVYVLGVADNRATGVSTVTVLRRL